ncbi:LysM peptidoglycan-binding domain-containing protein [Vagococcus lutrae]|uniref:aggregation-promoting factor n=1 Tax=Vagococcus lutrae TaxID=81947 RepID=UPI00200F3F66|nr:LysM peptidoglycan-binding domain-containing protein [Vagococcus lutrae]MDO5742254.1 LysM peptidoglycan-binding domain-containing protein [Vagococcus sp.]UQF23217.1 LysM peptidoglycan-binding domain-containing protein [Vagococcus lutrae]UQF38551.1 LysM peptidoglycan-binding domain-containing protein [Vagococcus lutrae]UQF64699.1 LysM peptidoglycan-binding domain-containing protein [Vagococcus lutrae]
MKLTKSILGLGLMSAALFTAGMKADAAEVKHTVQSGDTLSAISLRYFGDASQYKVIADKNEIKDANLIMPGQVLVLDTDKQVVYTEPTAAEVAAAEEVVEVAPVQETAPVQEVAPVQEAAPAQSSYVANSSSAKEWIAMKESTNNYNATNGRYIGKYQLDASYLNGDYSPENQERVADQYVAGRYGSWENAQAFWLANGWY